MTVPMKRAYVRKDKSPEAKAVEFVKSNKQVQDLVNFDDYKERTLKERMERVELGLKEIYAKRTPDIQDKVDSVLSYSKAFQREEAEKLSSMQKQIDALNKSYAQLVMTSANHQNCLEKVFSLIEDSWSSRIRKFMGL